MALKINPFHQLVWRSPNTLQIGTDFRSRVIERLTPAQERLIDSLYYGIPESQLSAVAKQIRLPESELNSLMEQLSPLLIKTTDAWEPSRIGIGERVQASLDNGAEDGEILSRRAECVVQVERLDATGLGLTLALAAAGVGTVLSPDHSKVTDADSASNLYPRALLGYQRFQAAKLILDSSWPGSRLISAARVFKSTPKPQLVVLTSQQVTPLEEIGRWRTLRMPHLEIRYHSTGVDVSPVVTADSPCLLCREHYAQDVDSDHLAMVAQLANAELKFDDSATRLVGTGLAAQQILRYLDRAGTSVTGTSVKEPVGFEYLRLPETKLVAQAWAAHANCGCQVGLTSPLAAAG
jgi:hypothetical protein